MLYYMFVDIMPFSEIHFVPTNLGKLQCHLCLLIVIHYAVIYTDLSKTKVAEVIVWHFEAAHVRFIGEKKKKDTQDQDSKASRHPA